MNFSYETNVKQRNSVIEDIEYFVRKHCLMLVNDVSVDIYILLLLCKFVYTLNCACYKIVTKCVSYIIRKIQQSFDIMIKKKEKYYLRI